MTSEEVIEVQKVGSGEVSEVPMEQVTSEKTNYANIGPIEGGVDLQKYHKQKTTIELVDVEKVSSKFTECKTQWVLRVQSKTLESMEKKLEDGTTKTINFRASELFNLIQDEEGTLKGFPVGEGTNLVQFLTDFGIDVHKISNLEELIQLLKGLEVEIKAYEKEGTDGTKKTFLKFRY